MSGDAPVPVGLDGREQVAGAGAGMRRAIGGQRRFDREPVGRDGAGQGLGGDLVDRADRAPGTTIDSSVFVPTMTSMSAPAPASDAIDRTRGDDVPVDHRLPRQHAGHHLRAPALRVGMRDEIGLQLRLGLKQAIDGDRRDRLSGRLDAKLLGEALADPPRGRGRDHLMRRPALGDRAPEQPLGAGHGQQRADAHRTGRLAEDGDVAGIAAEGGDVLPHPLEGGDLVEQAEVGVSVAEIEEALGADPVIDGHADDAVAGEAAAVIPASHPFRTRTCRQESRPSPVARPTRGRGDQMLRFRQSSPRVASSGMSTSHGGGYGSWGGFGP